MSGPAEPVTHGQLELPVKVSTLVVHGQNGIVVSEAAPVHGVHQKVARGPPELVAGAHEQVVDQLVVQLEVPAEALRVAQRPVQPRQQVAPIQHVAIGIEPRLDAQGQLLERRHQQADAVDE